MLLLGVFLILGYRLSYAADDDLSCIYDPCGCMIKASENGEFDKNLCEQCREAQNAPMHYCDCHAGTKFYYGLDEYVNDTVWYTIRLEDVIDNGFVAYWFSQKGVTLDIFLQCNVNTPFLSQYVPANSSYTLAGEGLEEMVQKYGSVGEMVAKGMDIHIRVAPEQGAEGHVMCFQKDHGFHSTCDDICPVYERMKYGISYSDNVYEMKPDIMGARLFVMWRQDDNLPIEMDILEQCDGEPITFATLTDSLHVYFIDTLLLQKKKAAGESLFFRFRAEHHGTLKFSHPYHWRTYEIDSTLCNGQQYELRDLAFTSDTAFIDTIRFIRDTITESKYRLQFEDIIEIYDTLYLEEEQMPVYNDFYDVIIREYKNYTHQQTDADGCTTEYILTVLPVKKDEPICPGDPSCPPDEPVCPGDPSCPPDEPVCPGDPSCPPDEPICPGDPDCPPDEDGLEEVFADTVEPLLLTDITGRVILGKPTKKDVQLFLETNKGTFLLVVKKGNEQVVMKFVR